MTHVAARLALALVLCASVTALAQEAAEEWERPYPEALPGYEPEGVVVVRVLEEIEGVPRPVAGGRVHSYPIAQDPTLLAPPLVAEAVSDEYGFARLSPAPDATCFLVAEAEGKGIAHVVRAPAAVSGCEILLPGGEDRSLHVLDPFGRPLARARLELHHEGRFGPACRSTASGEDGVAVLRNVPLDLRHYELVVVAPAVWPGPYEIPDAQIADPAAGIPEPGAMLVTKPGLDAHGVLVDEEGKPVGGAVLRPADARWPVTITDERGAFRLLGVRAGEGFAVFQRVDANLRSRYIQSFHPEVALRVALARIQEAERRPEEEREYRVTVRVGDRPRVPVALCRLSDGHTRTGWTGKGTGAGRFVVSAPAGDYRVTVGGGFSGVEEDSRVVRVPGRKGQEIEFEPVRQPRLSAGESAGYVIVMPWPDADYGRLVIPGASMELYPNWPERPPSVPASTPAAVVLEWPRTAVLRIGEREKDQRAVEIPPLHGRYLLLSAGSSEGGALAARWALDVARNGREIRWSEAAETVPWGTHAAGPVLLRAAADGHAPVAVDPEFENMRRGATKPIHVVLEPLTPRMFRLVDARGHAASGVTLNPVEPGWEDPGETDGEGRVTVGVAGRTARYRVRGKGWYPHTIELSTDTPETVVLPGTDLEIFAAHPFGPRLDFSLWLDGLRLLTKGKSVSIRAVPPGPHTIVVGVAEALGQVERFVVSPKTTDYKMTVLIQKR